MKTFRINPFESWHPTYRWGPLASGKDASIRGSMDPTTRQEQVGTTPAPRPPARGRGNPPWGSCESAAASEPADAAQELLLHLQVRVVKLGMLRTTWWISGQRWLEIPGRPRVVSSVSGGMLGLLHQRFLE